MFQISISVQRNFGSSGQIRVSYTTVDGSAISLFGLQRDFEATSGRLFFGNGQNGQSLTVNIMNDILAEGPEEFYINLTSIELLDPV